MATFIRGVGDNGCCGCRTSPCDAPPLPTLKCDSISATKTKSAFLDYVSQNTPSGSWTVVPKVFARESLGGFQILDDYGNCASKDPTRGTIAHFVTGYAEFDKASGVSTYNNQSYYEVVAGYDPAVWGNVNGTFYQGSNPFVFSPERGAYEYYSVTNFTATGTNSCPCDIFATVTHPAIFPAYAKNSDSVSKTLSNEYTTSELIANTISALPSYPNTWTGTCSSYFDLPWDELTCTIRRFKYKFQLPTLTGYSCYKITWKEGGVDKSYLWNGSDTETPVYTVNEPLTNGTVSITNVAASCLCS